MTSNPTVRVLVVDDEAGVREILREVLEAEGYEVIVWVSGYDGLGEIAVGEIGSLKRVSRSGRECFS